MGRLAVYWPSVLAPTGVSTCLPQLLTDFQKGGAVNTGSSAACAAGGLVSRLENRKKGMGARLALTEKYRGLWGRE